MHRLIVTADDYGLTDATSRAIIEAHRHGIVTATSVLAVAPGIDARLAWLDDVPDLSVGVHLALVGEDPPVLAASEIGTLVDRRGSFRRSWRQLVPALAAQRVDPEDIRRELSAQIAVVQERHAPTHLDTHQHVHLWPSVAPIVVGLAKSEGIGAVRVPRSNGRGPRSWGVNALARRLAALVDAEGLDRTDRFCGLDEAGGWSTGQLLEVLGGLASEPELGSVECNVHPGPVDDPDRARFAWGYAWGQELAALVDPDVRKGIGDLGYRLVGR